MFHDFPSSWISLAQILLGPFVSTCKIEIEEEDVVIKTSSIEVKSHLEKVLSSSQFFYENLPFTIAGHSSSAQLDESIEKPIAFLQDTVAEGVAAFEAFFKRQTLDGTILFPGIFNEKKGARSENHVLYTIPIKDPEFVSTLENYIRAVFSKFEGADVSLLKEIWNNPFKMFPESSVCKEKIDLGLLKQCIGIMQNPKTNEKHLYFNYGLLYRISFSPAVSARVFDEKIFYASFNINLPQVEWSSQNAITEIRLNKKHVHAYVQQLLPDTPLLHLYKAREGDTSFVVKPLFFGNPQLDEAKPSHYTIILQRGTNLESTLLFEARVWALLDKLRLLDDTAQVRIVFCDKMIESQEFSISEIQKIEQFISGTILENPQDLFSKVTQELSQLSNSPVSLERKLTFFVFSSGDNAYSSSISMYSTIAMSHVYRDFDEKGLLFPRIFTMGIGQYNVNALMLLARWSKARFFHLKELNDFNQIEAYFSDILYQASEILFEVVGVQRKAKFSLPSLSLPVYALPLATFIMKQDEMVEVKMGHQQSKITISDPRKVPLATAFDIRHEIAMMRERIFTESYIRQPSPEQMFVWIAKMVQKTYERYEKEFMPFETEVIMAELIGDFGYSVNFDRVDWQDLPYQGNFLRLKFEKSHVESEALYLSAITQANYLGNELSFEPVERTPLPHQCPSQASQASGAQTLYNPFASIGKVLNGFMGTLKHYLTAAWISVQKEREFEPSQMVTFVPQKNSSHQSSMEADCTLTIEKMGEDTVSSLACRSADFEAHVFHKAPPVGNALSANRLDEMNHPIQGDSYSPATCRAIEYAKKPALWCEGEKTDVIVRHYLPSRPLENLNGNLMMLLIAQNLSTASEVKKPINSHYIRKVQFENEVRKIEALLRQAQSQLQSISNIRLKEESAVSLEEFKEHLKNLKSQIKEGKVLLSEVLALRRDVEYMAKYPRSGWNVQTSVGLPEVILPRERSHHAVGVQPANGLEVQPNSTQVSMRR